MLSGNVPDNTATVMSNRICFMELFAYFGSSTIGESISSQANTTQAVVPFKIDPANRRLLELIVI